MEKEQRRKLTEAKRAAKILLDNHEFSVVYEYMRKQMEDAVLGGTVNDAGQNLLNYKALINVKALMEHLSNDTSD